MADPKLVPAKRNSNKHTQRGMGLLNQSMRKIGYTEPMVAAANGETLSGNARLEAAEEVFTDIAPIVIHSDGTRPIVHIRDDISDSEQPIARQIIHSANRIAQVNLDYDVDVLLQDAAAGIDLDGLGFRDDEVKELLAKAGMGVGGDADAEPQVDRAQELQEKWGTARGQLWLIGQHKLLCGDSTVREDVERVMQGEKAQLVFTDPPYGVDYDGGTKVREKLEGDTSTDLYAPCCAMAYEFSDGQSPLYLWHAGIKGIAAAAAAAAAAIAAGYEIRCEIVWNKNQAQYGALSAQYKQKHEPCYYCYKRGKTARWVGPTTEITVWDIDRASVNEFHPTQKPIELAVRAIGNHSASGDIILDLFAGSGSTLVAAQNTNCKGRGLELSPAYCAVILQRMADAFPGLPIELVS